VTPDTTDIVEGPSVGAVSIKGAALAAVVGGGIGFVLNSMPVSFVNGTSLVFGGIAALVVALRYGGVAGAAAAAVAFFPTIALWETPIFLLLAVVEAFVVGNRRSAGAWAVHRAQLMVWLLVGTPILWLWYLGVREMSAAMTAVITVKNIANAVFSLSLARVIEIAPRFWGAGPYLLSEQRRHSLRDYLAGAAAIGVAIPTILSLVVLTSVMQRDHLRDEADRVQNLALAGAATVSGIMQERMASIEAGARLLGGGRGVDTTLAQAMLTAAGASRQSFLTMLVTDGGGDFVAGYAPDPAVVAMLRRDGFNVADREYFTEPRTTGRAFVSEVFIGRGFGNDRIIALSAPILGAQGEFLGVVEGSMATSQLQQFLGAVPAAHELILFSRSGQVIVWDDSAPPPPTERLELSWGRVLSTRTVVGSKTTGSAVVLERRDEPRVPIPAQTRLVARAPGPFGWEVVARRTVLDARAEIQSMIQLTLFGSLGVFLLLRLIFVRVLRDVLEPLASIEAAVDETPMNADTPVQPIAPRIAPSAPRELVALAAGFDAMASSLSARFAELQKAISERDRLNVELEESAVALDQLVQRRTGELETALNEARAASASKTEFLASMSHELRTPLNAMIGSVDTLREGLHGPINPRQDASLETVEMSAQHLLSLINDILDTEKLESGRLQVRRERVDVRALVDRVMTSMQPLAEQRGIALSSEVPAGMLWIDADALRLQQVLLNLVGNAVKFTPQDGRVTIRARTGPVAGAVVRFEVEDSGHGIPEDQRTRIFEPFTRLETGDARSYEGSGLGLSISRRLCNAMGLRIAVASSSESGTVFVVERATE
jgi:two-component system, sensor histidine kinase